MTRTEIMEIALAQSAIDLGCRPEDFLSDRNMTVRSTANPTARRYLELPFSLDMVSYGSNVVASCSDPFREIAERYLAKTSPAHAFETPSLHLLDADLAQMGQKICFMAEYFLPDPQRMRLFDCPYPTVLLSPKDFARSYTPEWSNALCADRRELDVLAVGAIDGDRLVGLAGCSADCERMWQIGIDVLPDYRQKGIGASLVGRLAAEILSAGRVPFYCAAWCNLRSVKTALKCGFTPGWVEITAKPRAFVDAMNGEG